MLAVVCLFVVMAGVIASKVRKQRGAVKANEDDPTTAKILNVSVLYKEGFRSVNVCLSQV